MRVLLTLAASVWGCRNDVTESFLTCQSKRGGRQSWKKAAAMAGLELLLLVGTRDDEVKKVCSGA